MGALAGYVLNFDAWDAWVKLPDENGKGGRLKKFKKGDKLDDVVIDEDRVEYLLEEVDGLPRRPMFVKSTEDTFPVEELPGPDAKSAFVAPGEMPADKEPAKKEAPKPPQGNVSGGSNK